MSPLDFTSYILFICYCLSPSLQHKVFEVMLIFPALELCLVVHCRNTINIYLKMNIEWLKCQALFQVVAKNTKQDDDVSSLVALTSQWSIILNKAYHVYKFTFYLSLWIWLENDVLEIILLFCAWTSTWKIKSPYNIFSYRIYFLLFTCIYNRTSSLLRSLQLYFKIPSKKLLSHKSGLGVK